MIYLTHPFEGETEQLLNMREHYGAFMTKKIQAYLPDWPVYNFPLTWRLFNQEMGLAYTDRQTIEKAMEFIAKADAAIIINFPGQDLCERTNMERKTMRRLDIPMVELPFAQHRADQLIKQDALSSDQKRALNLLRVNLLQSQEV